MYMRYHSNQSLITQLSLHSPTVTPIFTIFSCSLDDTLVCQNILKTTVHCPAVILLWRS